MAIPITGTFITVTIAPNKMTQVGRSEKVEISKEKEKNVVVFIIGSVLPHTD